MINEIKAVLNKHKDHIPVVAVAELLAVIDGAEEKQTYDVEKVVEQLMIVHDEGYCPSETLECVLDKTCSDCYREKITEIVRKSGVE